MAQPAAHFERVRALAVSARTLAIGGVRARASSQLTLYDFIAEKLELAIEVPAHVLGLAALDEAFVAACSDGKLRTYDAKDGKLVREIAAHTGAVNAIAVRGDVMASAGNDGALRVWTVKDGKRVQEHALSSRPLRAVAIDPEGEAFAAAGDDGVVRVIWPGRKEDARRDMSGHDGGVTCLTFTPADGRLISGGEDGTIRLWYLAGDVDADVRGKDDSGHAGGVTALVFIPAKDAKDPALIGERFASTGVDGKVRVWRVSERRKPRSFETSEPLHALAFATRTGARAVGELLAAGDARTIFGYGFDAQSSPTDRAFQISHGFDVMREGLAASARPRREATIKTLGPLEEPEALELLIRVLSTDRDPDVRALAATEIAAHGRRGARKALRERLDDDHAKPRTQALAALRTLEPDAPLAPLRAGLESKFADMRVESIRALVPLASTSPLATGLVASALDDADASVRRAALAGLVAIHPKGSAEPLRVAFDRGAADVRAEVLVRGARTTKTDPAFTPLVGKGLDDADADVRRIAFVVTALEEPKLVAWLEKSDEAFVRAIEDVLRRASELDGKSSQVTDAELAEVRKTFGGRAAAPDAIEEKQREPLLAALACRTADTSHRGARGLALLGDMRALGALLTISRDVDPSLRRDSAFALAALSDSRAKRRIVWMLNDTEASVRDAAFQCASKLEPDAIALARAALHGSEEDIRVRGLDVLVKQGKKAGEVAETLLGDSLEDEAAKVRGEAFRTLWAWHTKDPLVVLDRALLGRFPDLRLRAVTELTQRAKEDPSSLERLARAVGDRDAGVAKAAYDATLKIKGEADADTHLAAFASTQPTIRAQGAKDAAKAPVEKVRSGLTKLLEDVDPAVRYAAIESLDPLLPKEPGPLHVGLQSSFLDLRVRAAELLAVRRDDQIVNPMQALIADKDLLKRMPEIAPLRQRGAMALASLGSTKLLRYFGTELIKDEDPIVREQAARGVSNASRRGEEGFLLDLLGHVEVAVRSWAAEGLARLGDARALPVLTGTLRHEHPPIRVGAVLSFAALGPEGYGGMLQGLEDPSRDVQRIVLSIILARDLRAFRKQEAPELLTSALSSERPEVRFAAARAIELRIEPAAYTEHLIAVLMPEIPEKATDMAKWPNEETRARLMVGLAEALAGDRPEQRYAAAQALRLRDRPVEYFREAQRATALRSASAPWVPETAPRAPAEPGEAKKGPLALLRKLFASGADADTDAAATVPGVSNDEQRRLRLLAFGAYVGLLRQATGDDEGHRVRRDAIDRIVDLATAGHVSVASVTPALARALDDPHHLVRKAAFSALERVYGADVETPLSLALASSSADVVRAALDELAKRGDAGKARIQRVLDSNVPEARKYAFELLERLSPKGSAEPLLAALESQHTDVRIGVLERLATSMDPRVAAALGKALESAHDDLRLRAAELLAARKDDRAIDVLAAVLRADDDAVAARARAGLAKLGSAAAIRALGARFEDQLPDPQRAALVDALASSKAAAAIDVLASRFADETESIRAAAFAACVAIAGVRSDAKPPRSGPVPKRRDAKTALRFLEPGVHAKAPDIRLLAACELDDVDDPSADALCIPLFADRNPQVRTAAVHAYAKRVEKKGAKQEPLEEVMRASARDTLLPAAEGLAHVGLAAAFRALLLVARAGEAGERERALLALGTLGDPRSLAELEIIAAGGTEDAPAEPSMQAAALEALGRLLGKLKDDVERERVRDRIESSVGAKVPEMAAAALRALRWIGGERSRSRLEGTVVATDSTEEERRVAAECLGELADVASEASLGRALADDAEDVRWAAREALTKIFPKEQTRIEFLAVESEYDDISGPAAAFLADEGDAALLLTKLGALSSDDLRERIRFGLARRQTVPAADIAKLLGSTVATARADAAWLAGARSTQTSAADRTVLGKALTDAAHKAETGFVAAKKAGNETAQEAESTAWIRAVWAARLLAGDAFHAAAKKLALSHDVPSEVRVQALLGLHGDAALKPLIGDSDLALRFAAASALGGEVALRSAPLDPVVLGRALSAVPKQALASDEGRKVHLALVLRSRQVSELAAVARDAKGQDRLDAIAALSLTPGAEADKALRAIAFSKSEPEDVRRAAYKALRRALRGAARENRKAHGAEEGGS